MVKIKVDEVWRETFPGAHIGMLLIGGVDNSSRSAALDKRKKQVEVSLREKYAGLSRPELFELDVLGAYKTYYRQFNKTYHVQLQLESIVHKGKSLPRVSPLVDANFAAEMETMLLTAGHDADRLEWPVTIGVSKGDEAFVQLNGTRKVLKTGDMIMADEQEVVCSVIYGQDRRTPISPETRRAFYVTYVPTGIIRQRVEQHLETIKSNVLLFAPRAEVEYQDVVSGVE